VIGCERGPMQIRGERAARLFMLRTMAALAHPPSALAICWFTPVRFIASANDVMPTDSSVLGFTNRWYDDGVVRARTVEVASGVSIRVLSAPYFVVSKLEAFKGRGGNDYLASADIEDTFPLARRPDDNLQEKHVHLANEYPSKSQCFRRGRSCSRVGSWHLASRRMIQVSPGNCVPGDPQSAPMAKQLRRHVRDLDEHPKSACQHQHRKKRPKLLATQAKDRAPPSPQGRHRGRVA